MSARVLIVEDDGVARELLAEVLRGDGHAVMAAASVTEALDLAREHSPAVLVTDLQLDGENGIELMRTLRAEDPTLQAIVVTAFGSLEAAVDAIQSGAFDYLSKPFAMEEMSRMVRRALEARDAAEGSRVEHGEGGQRMVGRSAAITEVYKAIARVAPSRASVLVHGETGTGKELVARAIHDASPRAAGPYIGVNCPSLPEGLLESELFGHVRGAFTGATDDRAGLFEMAEGGTLLLDEIGDMPLPVQAKLLRVLETAEVRRVGASSSRTVDVRVVAATHRDLSRAAREGAFREDLLYRLNTVTIEVPPLRKRVEDIPLLVTHFLARFETSGTGPARSVSARALAALESYPWPGNVRELAHVLERALALARGAEIGTGDLPAIVVHADRRHVDASPPSMRTLEEVERAHIESVLRGVGGARGRAAAILGIDRKTLYRKLRAYGLDTADDQASPDEI